jgi:hypothetical protein
LKTLVAGVTRPLFCCKADALVGEAVNERQVPGLAKAGGELAPFNIPFSFEEPEGSVYGCRRYGVIGPVDEE